MSNQTSIPLTTCAQFFKKSNSYWNWDLPKAKLNNKLKTLILECKLDYKKGYPSDILILRNVYWSQDRKLLFSLFDVKNEDDCVIAYVYDIDKKSFNAKFYIPMA